MKIQLTLDVWFTRCQESEMVCLEVWHTYYKVHRSWTRWTFIHTHDHHLELDTVFPASQGGSTCHSSSQSNPNSSPAPVTSILSRVLKHIGQTARSLQLSEGLVSKYLGLMFHFSSVLFSPSTTPMEGINFFPVLFLSVSVIFHKGWGKQKFLLLSFYLLGTTETSLHLLEFLF